MMIMIDFIKLFLFYFPSQWFNVLITKKKIVIQHYIHIHIRVAFLFFLYIIRKCFAWLFFSSHSSNRLTHTHTQDSKGLSERNDKEWMRKKIECKFWINCLRQMRTNRYTHTHTHLNRNHRHQGQIILWKNSRHTLYIYIFRLYINKKRILGHSVFIILMMCSLKFLMHFVF